MFTILSFTFFRLKKLYRHNREELGQTGQGLVDREMVHEIEAGTNLANVWGKHT